MDYDVLPHALDAISARDAGMPMVTDPLKLERGDVEAGLAEAPHRLQGRVTVGGQDHMYLEGHIAFAIPGEDDDVTVHCSTQHPSEAQHMVSHVLGVPSNAVVVNVRRMGGGFGRQGKPDEPVLRCRSPWRQEAEPTRQDPPRPRSGHDGDRQAA